MSKARDIGDSAAVINFLDGSTSNIQNQLSTLDTAIGNVSVTSGSLTKTFAADETATVTLTGNVLAPVVTATKEVAQTGVTNNDWDAAAGSYTLENSAPATTLNFSFYEISSATYDSTTFGTPQEAVLQGVAFKTDGTKMFVTGSQDKKVQQYSLSTAWDISTASFDSVDFSLSSQDTFPTGLTFSADGTELYAVGNTNGNTYQYSLSSAFDMTSASYTRTYTSSSQDNDPQGVQFNSSGTRMFIAGKQNHAICEYELSTAWDISTASYTDSFSVSSQTTSLSDVAFDDTGKKMFVIANSPDEIFQYNLTTAFDVSTASYSNKNFSYANQEADGMGLAFNNDGTKFYIAGADGDHIIEYDMTGSSLSLGSGSFASGDVGKTIYANSGSVVLTDTAGSYTVVTALSSTNQVASGNWTMFAALYDSTADVLKPSGIAGAGFDLSVASYTGDTLAANILHGMCFGNNGTKMYTLQANNSIGNINEYTLSTPYLPSSGTYVAGFSVRSQDDRPRGIAISPDGTKLWMVGHQTDDMFLYNLSTAWDVNTASYSNSSIDFSSITGIPTGICWSADGTNLYLCEQNLGWVIHFNASTAFDITSINTGVQASGIGPLNAQETQLEGVAISADGKKLFITGGSSDKVHEYSLPTAFILTGATHVQSFDVSSQTNVPTDVQFTPDGSDMYVTSSIQGIWQYSTQQLTTATGYQPAISSTIDSTYWTDLNSMTATNAVGDGNVFYALSADGKTSWNILSNGTGSTFVVTVAGGKFVIDGVSQDSLTLQEGQTYIFNQADASNGSHPLRLSTTADGTHGGGTEYTTGVTTSGTPGSSGAYTQIVVAAGAPTLYYYCSAHSGMGGTITIGVTGVRKIVKNNSGTYQVNTNSTYGSETWANASTNTEVAALREAMTSASAVSGQYDLSAATYVDSFTGVNSQDTSPYGLCFSSTGHKMYISGIANNAVFEYDLSQNFDVSTASYTANIGVIAQDNSPNAVEFNNDGTKMYVAGDQNNSIYEYALSTAWSVTSATYTTSFSTASYGNDPWGIAFNSDGTLMFTIVLNGTVIVWALSTGFDISTASYSTNYSGTQSQLTYATGIDFNSDGTKMYVVDNGGQDVLTYTLSTGFDVSTASFSHRYEINRGGTVQAKMNNDGTKMFVLNYSYHDVREYTVGTTDYVNQMTSTEMAAINDASQITLSTTLDLAAIIYYVSGQDTPTYSGTALNYDANVINQGAILGTDYTYDAPAQNKVRITSVNAANLKIRVV